LQQLLTLFNGAMGLIKHLFYKPHCCSTHIRFSPSSWSLKIKTACKHLACKLHRLLEINLVRVYHSIGVSAIALEKIAKLKL
jgi:hypothetical protein